MGFWQRAAWSLQPVCNVGLHDVSVTPGGAREAADSLLVPCLNVQKEAERIDGVRNQRSGYFPTVGNERGPQSFRGAGHVPIYDLVAWDCSLGKK